MSESNTFTFHRGYTGHEHIPEFGLINMTRPKGEHGAYSGITPGRMYHPVLGRFLSPDPFVQAPDFSQNFNRYSYCLNNPLVYTDPSGEKWWHWLVGDLLTGGLMLQTAIITGVSTYAALFPITSQGYELQKFISPVAIKPSLNFSTIQNGIGFDISVGMPKIMPPAYRYHFGASYYFSSYGGYNGWETRSGGEWQFTPFISYSGTRFKSGEFSQSLNMITLGGPFVNVKYENDYMFGMAKEMPGVPDADGGDRWRTAAIQIDMGLVSLNLNMFTGDPGFDPALRRAAENYALTEGGREYYIGGTSNDPNLRAGVLSLSFGSLRIGRNSEQIRHVFQNKFAHDFLTKGDAYWFLKLPITFSWFWSFGTGNGNTLW